MLGGTFADCKQKTSHLKLKGGELRLCGGHLLSDPPPPGPCPPRADQDPALHLDNGGAGVSGREPPGKVAARAVPTRVPPTLQQGLFPAKRERSLNGD
jgi:hypothetical protein